MIYRFHGSYTSEEKELFESAQEEDLRKICEYLHTDLDKLKSIRFEIFDTREGKQDGDPHHSISRASARYYEMSVYRFWQPEDEPHFPHEITHLVAHTWTEPYFLETELDTWDNKKIKKTIEMVSTSFMQEGLAIAVDDIVFKRNLLEEGESKVIDQWCVEQLDQMPKNLTEVINLGGFGSFPNKVVVPFAASFSKFLLLTYGLEKYKNVYVTLKETAAPKENVGKILTVYGQTDNDLLDKWRDSIKTFNT